MQKLLGMRKILTISFTVVRGSCVGGDMVVLFCSDLAVFYTDSKSTPLAAILRFNVNIFSGSDLMKGNRAVQIWLNTNLVKNRDKTVEKLRALQ